MISGIELYKDQMVWVTGAGYGRVTHVMSDGGFVVKIGPDRMQFTAGGYLGRTRRVFFHDPIIVEPHPDGDLWRAFMDLVKMNYAAWMTMVENGKMKMPEKKDD